MTARAKILCAQRHRPPRADLAPLNGASRTTATAEWPPRPNSHIVSEAISVFFIAQNSDGYWVARAADAHAGGIFLMKQSALHFAKRHSPPFGCATVFLSEHVELDLRNQGGLLAAFLVATKHIIAGLVPNALQNLLARAAQARDGLRNHTAIERVLRQAHTAKNDGDLPTVR